MVGVSRYTVAEYLRRATVVGITRPVPAALDDLALERGFSRRPSRLRLGGHGRSWLASTPSFASLAHPPAVLGGISRRATRWLWLQPVLRSRTRLARLLIAHHAAEPPGRGAAIRRLCQGGGDRRRHGRDPAGAVLCGGAGRVQLHQVLQNRKWQASSSILIWRERAPACC